MSQTINDRLQGLRALFSQEGIQAFIIPSTDPHLSEYVAPHWKSREWISGFTGSAGTVVITTSQAGLWTDSRYFLQAAQQLKGTEIKLYKEMLPETPSISAFFKYTTNSWRCCRHRWKDVFCRRSRKDASRVAKMSDKSKKHLRSLR
mgnify:CR=1 FL=1